MVFVMVWCWRIDWVLHMNKKLLAIRTLVIITAIFNLIDMATTLYFVNLFGTSVEANPIMKYLLDTSPILFIVFKLIVSGFFTWFMMLLKEYKAWMWIILMPFIVYLILVVNNIYWFFLFI